MKYFFEFDSVCYCPVVKPKPRQDMDPRWAYVLLSFAVLLGLVVVGIGVKRLLNGSKEGGGLIVAGALFCVMPTVMLFMYRAQKKRIRSAKANLRADSAPWLRRADWAKGEIAGTENKAAVVYFVLAGFTVIIALAFSQGADPSIVKGFKAFIMIFFAVPVVALATMGFRAKARQKKFGQSVFKMASVPGVVGGKLEGKIEIGARLEPADGFKVKLQCLNIIGGGKSRQVKTLWEEEQIVRAGASADDPGHSAIPVSFEIPAECDESNDADFNYRVVWVLEARASVPGVDYLARFEVPVFWTERGALIR